MTRIWKFVISAALILLALGVLLAGAGFLTGASAARVWSVLSGQLDLLRAQLEQWSGMLFARLGL